MKIVFFGLYLVIFTLKYVDAQTFVGHSQLASAFATILGLKPQIVNDKNIPEQSYPFYSPYIRFMQGKNMMKSSFKEEAAEDKTLLFLEGQTMRHDRLLEEARKKRNSAKKIRDTIERIQGEESIVNNNKMSNAKNPEIRDEEIFNKAHEKLLEKQADLLEKQAEEALKLVQSVKLNPDKKETEIENCDILKIGPLKYIPQADEIRHYVNGDTTGQITGNAFTIYYKKIPKMTYFWEAMEPMFTNVADSPGCFEFQYNGTPQVFCASTKQSRNSWIDALTEAWFCKNMGIKGTLPSIKAAEKEEENISKLDIKPKKEENQEKKKALVNIEIGVDENLKPHIKVNGKEHRRN